MSKHIIHQTILGSEFIDKKEINGFTLNILEVIKKRWPVNPLEVARELGDDGEMKALSARYLYHFRKLKKLELIDMKKIGNSHVAWPIEMEKIRVVHDLLKGI
jgi:predicted transcriptional regulator